MNVREVLLESILSTIEEEQAKSVEKDILDELIDSVKSLKQSIQQCKDSILRK